MSLRGRKESGSSGLSKAERVRAILVDDILAGRLLPGKKLVEEELAARLGCSRTPVREALRHLDAIGLIQFRPRHGAMVVTLERRVMLDLFDAMAELESACAELMARASCPADLVQLRALPPSAGALAEMGAGESLLSILHRAAGNPVLAEMAQTVRSRLLPYWRLLMAGKIDWGSVGAEAQKAVIAAIIAGDGLRAREAVHDLILTARHLAEIHIPLPQLP
jgi:DNA-binding GntR family transcriptional regulator